MYNKCLVAIFMATFLLGLAEVTGAMDRLRQIEREIRRPTTPNSAPKAPNTSPTPPPNPTPKAPPPTPSPPTREALPRDSAEETALASPTFAPPIFFFTRTLVGKRSICEGQPFLQKVPFRGFFVYLFFSRSVTSYTTISSL